jgi:aminoglycoside 6'-N-acetyltransferase I
MLIDLRELGPEVLELLAQRTLPAAIEHAPAWLTDLAAARDAIAEALADDAIARVAFDDDGDEPIGWVAAKRAWDGVWELHPLIVAIEHQRRGVGRRLVRDIERLAAAAGGLTMTLTTSDSVGATSLSGVDLYDDPLGRLAAIEIVKPHAVEFWRRIGYRITGVVPDAEGIGVPSIALSRRL